MYLSHVFVVVLCKSPGFVLRKVALQKYRGSSGNMHNVSGLTDELKAVTEFVLELIVCVVLFEKIVSKSQHQKSGGTSGQDTGLYK